MRQVRIRIELFDAGAGTHGDQRMIEENFTEDMGRPKKLAGGRLVGGRMHEILCRAFGWSPVHTAFDLPSTFGGAERAGTTAEGFVFFDGKPVGKISQWHSGQRFADADPDDAGLRERLGMGAG